MPAAARGWSGTSRACPFSAAPEETQPQVEVTGWQISARDTWGWLWVCSCPAPRAALRAGRLCSSSSVHAGVCRGDSWWIAESQHNRPPQDQCSLLCSGTQASQLPNGSDLLTTSP